MLLLAMAQPLKKPSPLPNLAFEAVVRSICSSTQLPSTQQFSSEKGINMHVFFLLRFLVALGFILGGLINNRIDYSLGGFYMMNSALDLWWKDRNDQELGRLRNIERQFGEWKTKHGAEVERQKQRIRDLGSGTETSV